MAKINKSEWAKAVESQRRKAKKAKKAKTKKSTTT